MQEQILSKIKKGIRNTNSFFSIDIIKQKIKNKCFEIFEDDFFLGFIEKSEYSFSYLYFYIEDKAKFDLKGLESRKELIVDIIFSDRKKENWMSIIEKFNNYGFERYASFDRMVLNNTVERNINYKNHNVRTAKHQDLMSVKLFLENNFDIYAERIPTINELKQLLETTYLIKENDNIVALLISDKNGFTEELRYWLVDEKYRGKGYGSILMKYFLNTYASTTRFLLWVQKDNKEAIDKYKYFGFQKDNLNMLILKK